MAKKKNKLKLGIRGILGIGCFAIWLIYVYAQIKEDLGIAHQNQVPYRFADSLGSICKVMSLLLIVYIVILGFFGMFFTPDKNKKE